MVVNDDAELGQNEQEEGGQLDEDRFDSQLDPPELIVGALGQAAQQPATWVLACSGFRLGYHEVRRSHAPGQTLAGPGVRPSPSPP